MEGIGVYIFLDGVYTRPLYAEPDISDEEPKLWQAVCEAVEEAAEGERSRRGSEKMGRVRYGWRVLHKAGIAFAVTVPGRVSSPHVESYLEDLAERYLDEIVDIRNPDPDSVESILIDVIAPWEEED